MNHWTHQSQTHSRVKRPCFDYRTYVHVCSHRIRLSNSWILRGTLHASSIAIERDTAKYPFSPSVKHKSLPDILRQNIHTCFEHWPTLPLFGQTNVDCYFFFYYRGETTQRYIYTLSKREIHKRKLQTSCNTNKIVFSGKLMLLSCLR